MLREIKLRQAVELMEKNEPVYAVNMDTQERQLVDLTNLFRGLRILADMPEEAGGGVKNKPGRKPKEPPEELIQKLADEVDRGKVKALLAGKWTTAQIADELGFTVPVMDRILKVLELN